MKLKLVSLSGSMMVFSLALVAIAYDSTAAIQGTQGTAQTAQPVPSPVQTTEPPAKLILREGTEVRLKFAQSVSSKTAEEGDSVNLVLDEDLKVGDVTVAKAGAKSVASVTHSKRAGMMGKAGELSMRLEYVIVGDARMRLRGSKGKEGQGKEGTAVVLTVLFGPLGLIKHGKNVEIKEGTPFTAYVDQDFTVPTTK
jgi:hypothetical protein